MSDDITTTEYLQAWARFAEASKKAIMEIQEHGGCREWFKKVDSNAGIATAVVWKDIESLPIAGE